MNALRTDGWGSRRLVVGGAGFVCAIFSATTTGADLVFDLAPVPGLTANTGEKPQSKVWMHAGTWWACLPSNAPNPSGTWIWRLENDDTWTAVLQVSGSTNVMADVLPAGDVAHILLYGGSPELVSIEYTVAGDTWQPWSQRPSATSLSLPGSETASIAVDSTGRLWLATESGSEVHAHYGDAPYGSFQGPVVLETGINDDDIAAVAALPDSTVGVIWSNQNSSRFGFRIHLDGDGPLAWSSDEVPSSQSAQNGFADDHINLAVASDGTLYASIKTSYDSSNEPTIGLLVRRPGGTWDDLHVVDSGDGTRGIVQLNEMTGILRVIYKTDAGNDTIIVSRDSALAPIAFGPEQILMTGSLNNPTSTKQNWTDELVVLASGDGSPQAAPGVIFVTDTTPGACCLVDGSCSFGTVADCAAAGGVFQGQNVLCADVACDAPGACCFGDGSCGLEVEAACVGAGGVFQGAGTDCAGDPCNTEIVNPATSDFATARGIIASGSFLDTQLQDDVAEALMEEQSNGPVNKRRSWLEHVWTFDVAAGSGYTFFVDAWHTPNSEGDDFVFSYSLDGSGYADMLTVTAVVDDDVLQGFAFPEDVAGTVFVKVEDLDHTRGFNVEDTLFVDEMIIVTTVGVDVVAPAPPANLVATGGDAVVLLTWDDNGEPDLDGYHVYRSEVSGGPYSTLTAQPLAASMFSDGSVVNGTTYHYVVTAVDTTGNESADSVEASATPDTGGASTMHVDSIVVSVVGVGGGWKIGRAEVVVHDSGGSPVAGALVTGSFTGDIAEIVSGTTDGSGSVTLDTIGQARKNVQLTFCVDDVTHASLIYDPADDQETCDVN